MGDLREIHIVFAPDENYVIHTGVAIASILCHAKEPSRFHFYCLQGEDKISQKGRAKLEEITRSYSAILDFIDINPALIKDLYIPESHWTIQTYYRFVIPDSLWHLERCIYLDIDLVALADLADLWSIDISGVAVAAVRDYHLNAPSIHGLEQVNCYFNAGVLYMNLKRWREARYGPKCLRAAKDSMRYVDQDALNLVLCNDCLIIPTYWNIQTNEWPKTEQLGDMQKARSWKEIVNSPKIAHFTTSRKPWNFCMDHYWAMEYWRTYKLTPWAKETKYLGLRISKARIYRLKPLISRVLRWMLSIHRNSKNDDFKIVVFGRLLVDKKMNKCAR